MGSDFYKSITNPDDAKWFANEAPVHQVRLTKGFWMGETEITVAQFRSFIEATQYVTTAEIIGKSLGMYEELPTGKGHWALGNGLSWRQPGFNFDESQPVVHVSWLDACVFCEWMSLHGDKTYSLPTEAQWEYAASFGGLYRYSWGNDLPNGKQGGNIADERFAARFPAWNYPTLARYDDGFVFVSPVRSYDPNKFGLYDMTGNVWEWMHDYYSETYYSISPVNDPAGPPEGTNRSLRGGGFDWELSFLRVAKRRNLAPDSTAINLGFRIIGTEKKF
ncbi:MAG: SUMF1/EgtB/PvdO family nonheme iron enzyme [Geobacteraceae bacterium]|nr:SUMF1/EgtB/PvdO family nonheme iron enzyme [Geobacteraceae bacterium]